MGKLDPLALAEISAFISLGMPIMTISTLIFLMNFVDIAMMGHYSKDGLAAVGIGAAWFMITYLPINGALFALDPVLSQAFGANDTQSYRTWFKSGTITISLLLPVTLLMLWFTKDILSAFSLDPELVAQTAVYTRFLLPGVPFVFGFQLMTKYFQCQHILAPAVWIALTANIANVILDYVFIFSLDQGVRGAAIATSLSRVFLFMGSIFCLALRPAYRTCFPSWADTPSLAQFQTIGRLALGGAGMVIVEVSSFEITTMLAAQLGQLALDSHVVAFNLFTLIFFVTSFPFGVAASIRVGNLIGSQQPLAALLSAKVAMVCVLACSCVMALGMFLCRSVLPRIYTSDPDILELASRLMMINAIFQVADSTQYCSIGILRGLARHTTALLINVFAFWVVGVPFGASLAFRTDLGVFGLWWGMTVGLLLSLSLACYILFVRLDWTELRSVMEEDGVVEEKQRLVDEEKNIDQ